MSSWNVLNIRFVCSWFWMKSLPGAVLLMLLWVLWAGLCLWCPLLPPAGGRNSQEMLMAQFSCLAWLTSLGAFPLLPAPGCHILWGPNGVTASCCAGGTSRLGHFPVLEPWRDYFRSVPLVLLWMTSSSWNHRVLKVGKALQDHWVQPSPESLNQAVPPLLGFWTLPGMVTPTLLWERSFEIKSQNFMATGWTQFFSYMSFWNVEEGVFSSRIEWLLELV